MANDYVDYITRELAQIILKLGLSHEEKRRYVYNLILWGRRLGAVGFALKFFDDMVECGYLHLFPLHDHPGYLQYQEIYDAVATKESATLFEKPEQKYDKHNNPFDCWWLGKLHQRNVGMLCCDPESKLWSILTGREMPQKTEMLPMFLELAEFAHKAGNGSLKGMLYHAVIIALSFELEGMVDKRQLLVIEKLNGLLLDEYVMLQADDDFIKSLLSPCNTGVAPMPVFEELHLRIRQIAQTNPIRYGIQKAYAEFLCHLAKQARDENRPELAETCVAELKEMTLCNTGDTDLNYWYIRAVKQSMALRLCFPNSYGYPLPQKQDVDRAQQVFGFSDALANYFNSQNGLREGDNQIRGTPVQAKRSFFEAYHADLRRLYSLDEAIETADSLGIREYFYPVGEGCGGNIYVISTTVCCLIMTARSRIYAHYRKQKYPN